MAITHSLVASDWTIASTHATMAFGNSGEVVEGNTYNVSVVYDSGDGEN